ncbi:MAG: hypothetical protein WBA74_04645, partial [Cyclobacteriaceae bacterium]
MKTHKIFMGIGLIMLISNFVTAQDKVLQLEDYEKWKRIVSTEISPDGEWFTYGLRPNGGDDTLFIKKTTSGAEEFAYRIPFANAPSFSNDNKWVVYLISPSDKEAEKLKKSKKKVFKTAELRNLATGDSVRFKRANSMRFSEDGKFLAISIEKAQNDKSKHKGQDLILLELATMATMNFGNVSDYAFNKNATHLAYT